MNNHCHVKWTVHKKNANITRCVTQNCITSYYAHIEQNLQKWQKHITFIFSEMFQWISRETNKLDCIFVHFIKVNEFSFLYKCFTSPAPDWKVKRWVTFWSNELIETLVLHEGLESFCDIGFSLYCLASTVSPIL